MYRLMAAAAFFAASAYAGFGSAQESLRVIEVTAERFAFSPSEIVLDAGEAVELHVSSQDTAHGFLIRGTDTNLTIPKRGQGQATVVVRFDRAGRYTFECSQMCGAGHHFMRGEFVVREAPAAP